MKKNPKVTVLMSVFDGKYFLKESIESILNQTFSDFEFIIINDGSTDASAEVIKAFAAQDNRILFIDRLENEGLPYSLNEGLMVSRGEYVARMDSDDISLPQRLEEQVGFLDKHRNIGVCGTAAYVIDEKGKIESFYFPPTTHDEAKVHTLFSACFIHPSVVIRASVLKKLSVFYSINHKNSQDYELWSRLIELTEFNNIPKVLICYRKTSDSIGYNTNKDGLKKRFPLVRPIHRNFLAKIGFPSSEMEEKLHFRLSLIGEMRNSKISLRNVEDYFNKILKYNKKEKYFNQRVLYFFLCRKFFIYFVLSRHHGLLRKGCRFNFLKLKLLFGATLVTLGFAYRRVSSLSWWKLFFGSYS